MPVKFPSFSRASLGFSLFSLFNLILKLNNNLKIYKFHRLQHFFVCLQKLCMQCVIVFFFLKGDVHAFALNFTIGFSAVQINSLSRQMSNASCPLNLLHTCLNAKVILLIFFHISRKSCRSASTIAYY